ncbi:MAG: penicillin-binding protein activator [Deltaproteobacteria bacterium]|nr:penicillin-binding protein activator [Deltaproteobacteria bacterium]
MKFASNIGSIVALLGIGGMVNAQTPDPGPVPAPVQEKDTVCLILPLTGPHEGLGRRVADAVERTMKAEMSDARVLRYDTKGTVLGAGEAVSQATEDPCSLAIGGLGDRESIAVADGAEAGELPLVALGLVPDGRNREHVVWARTPRDLPVKALAGHLVAVRGEARASLLYPDTPYGRRVAHAFGAAFQASGGRLRVEQSYPGAGGDLKAVAQRFATVWKSSGEGLDCAPEVIFVAADLATARRLVPFLRYEEVLGQTELAHCPPITVAGTGLWNEPILLAQGGDELLGAVFADLGRDESSADGADDRLLEMESSDAARLVLAALDVRKAPGREGIRDVFRSGVSWKSGSGELRLERGRVAGRKIVVYEIDRGALKPVDGM